MKFHDFQDHLLSNFETFKTLLEFQRLSRSTEKMKIFSKEFQGYVSTLHLAPKL